MPTKKTEDHSQTTPKKPISKGEIPIGGEPQNTGEEQIRSEQPAHHEARRNRPHSIKISHIPQIDVIEGREANKHARNANRIAFWSALTSGFLFIVTLLVFNQSRKQTEATIIAANAAKQSADLQKKALDSQISAKHQSDIADAAKLGRDTDFINKQKAGIDIQVASFKSAKEEFNKENDPLLEIMPNQPKGVDFSGHDVIRMYFQIRNISKIPIRVIRSNVKIYPVGDNINTSSYFTKNMLKDTDSFYYSLGNSPETYSDYEDPGNVVKKAIENGTEELLLVGRYEFNNYITNKIRYYDFAIIWYKINNQFDARIIVNKNYDLK